MLRIACESLGRSRHTVRSGPAPAQGQHHGQQGLWSLLLDRHEGRERSTLAVCPPGLLPPRGLQVLGDVSQNSCSVTPMAQEEDTRAVLTVAPEGREWKGRMSLPGV